jgi:hypothetical protein
MGATAMHVNSAMQDDGPVQFALEVDGEVRSLHHFFADAVRAGLSVQNSAPAAKINIRSLDEISPRAVA